MRHATCWFCRLRFVRKRGRPLHPREYELLRLLVMSPERLSRNRYFSLFEDKNARRLRGRSRLIRRLVEEVGGGGVLSLLVVGDGLVRVSVEREPSLHWSSVLSLSEFGVFVELLRRELPLGDAGVLAAGSLLAEATSVGD